jgi:hypothetical protein
MSRNMTDLLRCPFCSGEALLTHGTASPLVWDHHHFSRVFCTQCQFRQLFHRTDEEAAAAWNTRQQSSDGGVGSQTRVVGSDQPEPKSRGSSRAHSPNVKAGFAPGPSEAVDTSPLCPCPYDHDGCILETQEVGPCLCANGVAKDPP